MNQKTLKAITFCSIDSISLFNILKMDFAHITKLHLKDINNNEEIHPYM
jgi:hypothetical protein